MIFNSLPFIIFIIAVFVIYYFPLKEKVKEQNILLLISSYFFYGFADYKMTFLLLAATLIFYYLGIAIYHAKNEKMSSWLTTTGILAGVGLLFYFKYFGFFVKSFVDLINACGLKVGVHEFNTVMPLGISFFTFKLISYIIEVHRKRIEPTYDFIAFATYVAFFPTIMSGPIDRPNTFIPQLQKKRTFNYNLAVDGCRQFLWGLFKKVVLADNLAVFTEHTWNNIQDSSGLTLFFSAVLYSFQMYTDFSGYSDMAIGVGKLFGFNITINFKYPFFSTNIAEYWRRWHISLTSWLTDYVFMPLNVKFRNWNNAGIILAIMINMILVGMWHDANWTYAVFGLYHGLLFIPLILTGAFFKKKKTKTNKSGFPPFKDVLGMVLTFLLVTLGLIIFKAQNINQAFAYFTQMFTDTTFTLPNFDGMNRVFSAIIILCMFNVIEWLGKDVEYPIAKVIQFKRPVRWLVYVFIIFLIGMYMQTTGTSFIYFKF